MFSEVYAVTGTKNGEPITNNYAKGVTRVDNLGWVCNLGSELLVQRSLPIHEHDPKYLSSLEARKELMAAQALAKAKGKSKSKQDLVTYCA